MYAKTGVELNIRLKLDGCGSVVVVELSLRLQLEVKMVLVLLTGVFQIIQMLMLDGMPLAVLALIYL